MPPPLVLAGLCLRLSEHFVCHFSTSLLVNSRCHHSCFTLLHYSLIFPAFKVHLNQFTLYSDSHTNTLCSTKTCLSAMAGLKGSLLLYISLLKYLSNYLNVNFFVISSALSMFVQSKYFGCNIYRIQLIYFLFYRLVVLAFMGSVGMTLVILSCATPSLGA